VFLAETKDRESICIWDTDLLRGERGGGCNPASDFFGGSTLIASLAYDGGPSLGSVKSARIVGVVTESVARVEIVYSSGASDTVSLTTDQGFAYVVPRAKLAAGIEPIEVVAYDDQGRDVGRQPTGITR
jgi:hypothetical protein